MNFLLPPPKSTSLPESSLLFRHLPPLTSDIRPNNDKHNSLRHLCRYDDETFVFNFSEGRFTGCRRAEWLFYWAQSVYSNENIISSWRSLLESDDIWLQWLDGDEELLRALPSPSACTISPYGWRIASDTISRRLESQDYCDRASQLLRTTCPRQSVNAPIEVRMSAIAWLARTYTERVTGTKTIASLVLEWWYNMPYWLQNKLPARTDVAAWQKFSANMSKEGHTCHLESENQDKWKAWITVQGLLYPNRKLEAMNMISRGTRCQRCTPSSGRQCRQIHRKIPNHILLLQYIRHVVRNFLQSTIHSYADSSWAHQLFGGRFKWKMSFTTAALTQVDNWVEKELLARQDNVKVPLDWIELVTASSDGLANQQEVLEIENELAMISRNDSSSSSSSSSQTLDIRAWMCALILSSMTAALGTERSAARAFGQLIQFGDFKFLLDCAPSSVPTQATESFRDAVQESAHTCWSTYSADLYSSAYSLMRGQDDLSQHMIGCLSKRTEGVHFGRLDWHFTERECVSCREADISHDLGEAIDRGQLKSVSSLEDLMDELNGVREHDHDGSSLLTESTTSEDIAILMQRLIGLARLPKVTIPSSSLSQVGSKLHAGGYDSQSDAEESDDASSEITCKQYDRSENRTASPPPWNHSHHLSRLDEAVTLSTDDHATSITRESTYGATLQVFRYSSERESLNAENGRCCPTPKSRSKTDMIEAIKKHLLRLLEANDVPIETVRGVPKLPWRTLPHILQENGLVFDNWPTGVPQPRDGNGINKVPLKDITAIYETILRKDKALGIRPVRDAHGRRPLNVIMEDVKPTAKTQDQVMRKRSVSCCLDEESRLFGNGKLKRKRMDEDNSVVV
ncbi:hypothetical protein K435DRAFT_865839 [Dendrothele bispora CBS 962.96]|uniref:Uncharacterized protein n=1 Tax=Dendrothele bispora (strain CBS 962.96) TaxID=1314807 RepID=A0A4S8LII0_DENBC|nr:hypothetical protein K435DRAFT_865839 [Dendrothele bispora CBS 962.96]